LQARYKNTFEAVSISCEFVGDSRKEAFDLYSHINLKELEEAYLAAIPEKGYDYFLFRNDLKKAAYSSLVIPALARASMVRGSFIRASMILGVSS